MNTLFSLINSIAPISKNDFAELKGLASTVIVKKGKNILTKGEVCRNVYFINEGFFRMYYVNKVGNEINSRFAFEHSFLTDFKSFLTQQPTHYHWQAMQDAEVLAFDFSHVMRLYSESPAWEHFGRLLAEQVYLQVNDRIEMFQFMSPEERYLHTLSTQPNLFNRVSQFHLSSYLGIRPESLSRLRKRMATRKKSVLRSMPS